MGHAARGLCLFVSIVALLVGASSAYGNTVTFQSVTPTTSGSIGQDDAGGGGNPNESFVQDGIFIERLFDGFPVDQDSGGGIFGIQTDGGGNSFDRFEFPLEGYYLELSGGGNFDFASLKYATQQSDLEIYVSTNPNSWYDDDSTNWTVFSLSNTSGALQTLNISGFSGVSGVYVNSNINVRLGDEILYLDDIVLTPSSTGGGGNGPVVPLPAGVWMGLTGFVGLIALRRRRRSLPVA
jgi:hypothetical protein